MQLRAVLLCFATVVLACGPASRQQPGDDDDGSGSGGGGGGGGGGGADGGTCVPQGENTSGSAGSGCGTVNVTLSTPLALPDTNNQDDNNPQCTTNANCSGTEPNCIITSDKADDPPNGGMCAASYTDTLNFIGFCPGETLDDASKLLSVCATLEHSWVGDLQVDLISPDGKSIALHLFPGRFGTAIFLGHPNYCDSDANPIPGSGYEYCWTGSATDAFTTTDNGGCGAPGGCESWAGDKTACPDGGGTDEGVDGQTGPFEVVPAGNYKPDQPFTGLQGAQLNGNWTFRVTDLYAEDNGYLFNWSITFDPSLLPSCTGNIIQ
jgi:hypothetical protein